MPRILLIEDNADIALSIRYNFEQGGEHEVVVAADGEEGFSVAEREPPDLVLLDLNLPGMDGLEVCRQLRAAPKTRDIPIIMLTARVGEDDRIDGLDTGADDYVTKPFSIRELQARVRAILRRAGSTPEPAVAENAATRLRCGPVEIDRSARTVTVSGDDVALTRMEFDLLVDLIRHRGRVRTRDALLQAVWGYEATAATRTVDVHIRQLRRKLGKEFANRIETVIGIGYKLRPERGGNS